MSEQELYAIAERRVARRQRRWIWWSLNLLGLSFSLVAFIAFNDTPSSTLFLAAFLGWIGVFVFHSILLWMAEARDEDIAKEVAKLRASLNYEKPKRLELSDDGEIIEPNEPPERVKRFNE